MSNLMTEISSHIESLPKDVVENHEFDKYEDLIPIPIEGTQDYDKSILDEFVPRVKATGFALFEFRDQPPSESTMIQLATQLHLGKPYVPNYYESLDLYESTGLNLIESEDVSDPISHAAFKTTAGQDLHVDGTLTEIGHVKTSTLLCLSQGETGGETILFNAVGAFVRLFSRDQAAGQALFIATSLTRHNLTNPGEFRQDSVFKIIGGELVTRFSIDNTSDWEYGMKNILHLERAYEYLVSLAADDSPFFLRFTLKDGQGIILANDKLSHGRTAYTNGSCNQRKMLRGLFLKRLSKNS